MNILPKKNWHVLKKENIFKVKADIKNAQDEENKNLRIADITDQKNYLNILRKNSSSSALTQKFSSDPLHLKAVDCNDEFVEEEKQKLEKHEKSIGLLTYLGQSALEGKVDELWWTKPKTDKTDVVMAERRKQREEVRMKKEDPLQMIIGCEKIMDKRDAERKSITAPSYNDLRSHYHRSSFLQPSTKDEDKKKSKKRKRRHRSSSSSSEKKKKQKKKSKKKKHRRKKSSSSSEEVQEPDRRVLRQERIDRERKERIRADEATRKKSQLFPSASFM